MSSDLENRYLFILGKALDISNFAVVTPVFSRQKLASKNFVLSKIIRVISSALEWLFSRKR